MYGPRYSFDSDVHIMGVLIAEERSYQICTCHMMTLYEYKVKLHSNIDIQLFNFLSYLIKICINLKSFLITS